MNFIHKQIVFALALGIITPTLSIGQTSADTIIKTQEFNVYQVYKPEIAKKTKKEIVPQLPTFDTINPVYRYEVPPQTLQYVYQSVAIKPLALGVEKTDLMYENYLKAGVGNNSSILLDAGITALKGERFQSLFHLKHLSQKGGAVHRQSSNTQIDATAYYQLEEHDIIAHASVLRNGLSYYGIKGDSALAASNIDDFKQAYFGAKVQVGLQNTSHTDKYEYLPMVGLGIYTDQNKAKEFNFNFNLPFDYVIKEGFKLGVVAQGDVTSLKIGSQADRSNNLLTIAPHAKLRWNKKDLHLGFKPTWGKNSVFYLLPDFTIKTPIWATRFVAHAGFTGQIIQNTFQQLTTKNPFLYNQYDIKQTKELRAYVGLDASLKNNISFGGTVAWKQWNNLPVFKNDYALTSEGRYYGIDYGHKIQAITIDAYFKYQYSEKIALVGTGSWTNFIHKDNLTKIYHEPQVKIGVDVQTRLAKGLSINAKIEYWDRIFYKNEFNATKKLPSFLDVSLQGEYELIPRLSVFLQLNNLLNNQYSRWNQYPVYGTTIVGGLRFKF